jgi:hypothetical protein
MTGEQSIYPPIVYNKLPQGPLSSLYRDNEPLIVYNDYQNLISVNRLPVKGRSLSIACVLPEGDELEMALQSIALFNQSNEEIQLYCHKSIHVGISKYCNGTISLHPLGSGPLNIAAHVIVTHSLSSLYFLQMEVPIVIVGPNGLGGWVTPDNFTYLSREAFMGRPAGSLWEAVPYSLLLEELSCILECKELESILKKNKDLAEQMPYLPSSSVAQAADRANALRSAIRDEGKRWDLVPRIASNIKMIQENGKVFFQRNWLHDIIASIDQEDWPFFLHFTGENTFRQIYGVAAMAESDFWEVMYSLLDKDIIVYS